MHTSPTIELRDSGLSSSLDFLDNLPALPPPPFHPGGQGWGKRDRSREGTGPLGVSDGHSRGDDKICSSCPPNQEASPGLGHDHDSAYLGGDERGERERDSGFEGQGRWVSSSLSPIPESVLSLRVQRKAMCPDLAQSWVGRREELV